MATKLTGRVEREIILHGKRTIVTITPGGVTYRDVGSRARWPIVSHGAVFGLSAKIAAEITIGTKDARKRVRRVARGALR
jgi:hypothetical protein